MNAVKKLDKHAVVFYSKNANEINVHKHKNQNILNGYLPAQISNENSKTRWAICLKLIKKDTGTTSLT